MIKKLFNKKIFLDPVSAQSVASAALLITMSSLASRMLGLLRDSLLASTFSAGDVMDVYYAAFRVPDMLYNFLIMGALAAAFIPIFTGLISNGEDDEAWKLANGVMNIALSCIILLALIFAIFAPYIMKVITPGFDPEKMQRVVLFTRIMFLSPVFLGISGIFGGILTSFKRFLVYSLAPIFYNFGIIIGILVFSRIWGPIGLAWGVVLGAVLHMSVQYPAARNLGFKHQWSLMANFRNKDVRKVMKLMLPRTLGTAINQFNLLVITFFASMLASGSLAVFNFAQNLQSAPLGLIGISFSIAVFPTLSAYWAKNEKDKFIAAFSETFRQILFFIIPISVFILLLRAQIVRVILGHGRFNWQNTTLTFECLAIFSLSFFAQCAVPLLARAFYAMHDTKTPFFIGVAAETVNIVTVLLLIKKYQILGLAVAFSLTNLVQMLLLLFFLRARFDSLDDKKIINSVIKVGLASVSAGIFVQIGKVVIAKMINMNTFVGVFTQLVGASLMGLIVFLAICQLLKLEEFENIKKAFSKRILKAKKYIWEDTSEVSGI